jgi:phosphoglycerate dehydrogenase-like enzyme
MKIVVADTVSLEEMHRQSLRNLGELVVYDDVPPWVELERRLVDADIAVIGWSTIDAALLDRTSSLKLISLWSTGYDHVDVAAARARGIAVTNVPGYAADTIAEFVIGSMIALSRQFLAAHHHVLDGQYDWKRFRGAEIRGKTLGIVGTGAIGSRVAALADTLGMSVIATTRDPSAHRAANLKVRYTPFANLLAESDIVSIHTALTPETRGLFDAQAFARMKRGAFIVNTARAEIVEQRALEAALVDGQLGGAALDVIDGVPLPPDHVFRTHPNVILTPHCAFNTREALVAKTDICVSNVERFIAGAPQNVVNCSP